MNKSNKFSFIKEIDLFGKEPEIYYKGKPKKTSLIGRIFTWLYIVIYIAFFIYKTVRVINRADVSFQETNSSTGGLPKLKVNKETFVYALSMLNEYGMPYINEKIYFPRADLVVKKVINNEQILYTQKVDMGKCTIDDFGKNFQQYASKLQLDRFYCFKNFEVEFEGYSSAENFTMIQIVINKCNITTEDGRICESISDIENKLQGRNLMVVSQDFDITPYDFEHPVKEKLNINTCPIRIREYQIFASYYQLTKIETDQNIFGFSSFSKVKTKEYLIYNSPLVMSSDMYEGQIPTIQYNILLTEKILTNQRKYIQFIDILGDVGGLMEIVYSIFGAISFFFADIFYSKNMINHLFSFNLNDYTIKIKNNLKIIEDKSNLDYQNNNGNDDKRSYDRSIHNKDLIIKADGNSLNKDSNRIVLNFKKDISKENDDKNINNKNNRNKNFSGLKSTKSNLGKSSSIAFASSSINQNIDKKDLNLDTVKIYENRSELKDTKTIQEKRLKKLNINIFCTYLCFCCPRNKEILTTTLFDESMGIIREKLDILNIFRNMYYLDYKKEEAGFIYNDHNLSDDTKDKLNKLLKYGEVPFDYKNYS